MSKEQKVVGYSTNRSGLKKFEREEFHELPYYKELKKIWKSKVHHCNDSESQHSYYKKGIKVCPEWNEDENGELFGFLHYYIWCIDNGYDGVNYKVERIDKAKDWSPQNCKMVNKPNKSEKQPIEKKTTKVENIKTSIKSQQNNVSLSTTDDVKVKLIDFLNAIGIELPQ